MTSSGGEGIPDAARELLRSRISSFEQIESLLLLQRHREREWTGEEVSEHLRIGTASAETALEHLRASGLLGVRAGTQPAYRFAPADASLEAGCSHLARSWTENRLAVIEVLTSEAMDRLRKSTLSTFADAFRLRRRKPDG